MRESVDEAVALLEERLGDDLHGVFFGNFVEHDYSIAYLNREVQDELDPGQIRELVDAVVDEQLSAHGYGDLDHRLGELRVSVRAFRNAVHVLAWDDGNDRGVFVGTSSDVRHVPTVVEALDEAALVEPESTDAD